MRYPDAAERDARLRAAFEHAPDGMVLIGPDGVPVAVNPAACEILGRSEEELLRGAFPAELLEHESEHQLTRGDGRSIWVVSRVSAEGVCRFTDVTARRAAHEDLRRSEERMREMLQTSNEGIWVLGADDLTSYVNARMPAMLGCTVDEMIGRPITDFLDEEDAQAALTRLDGRRRGVADQFEMKWRTPDGREVWTVVNANPIAAADGSYAGAFAMVTDITERVWHERAVRASEERYRNIIETTTEGVWMIDGEHRTTYVNRRMAEMLGYGVEEMLGRPAPDFLAEGGTDAGSGRPREVRYRRKDGSEMWGLLSGSPLTDGSGGYGGALAMVADITERKQSEESVARLAAIVESSPDAIFSTDTNAVITSWNAAAERIYGYTEEEAVGQSGWMLVLPEREEEAHEVGRTMLRGESMVDFPSKARTKDGRVIEIKPSVSAIRSPRGEVIGTLTIVRLAQPDRPGS
jgi:PAS domain S-box-containing protein